MKTTKLIALSTLILSAQAFAKGEHSSVYKLKCNLSTRTKVAVTTMTFNEESGKMSFSSRVDYDIFEPVPEKPFEFYIDDAYPGAQTEVDVTINAKTFNVSAYESRHDGGRAPELVKEFDLEGKIYDSGAVGVQKLIIDGVDHSDDVGLCNFSF
ncbi:MAG TPA: hypothetical protein VM901_13265 [Bdellovibrionota bacterium]|nr:hypothetical protein [Bdellovibrionota bacterium]